MSFADRMKAHLATYRLRNLRVTEEGLWARNQRPYPHILPKDREKLNILEPYREVFRRHAASSSITLHTDFHHLNSSQALAFNLFFPALVERMAHPALTTALTGTPSHIASWQFEAVPDTDEGTNFDLLLTLETGSRIYIEVKFTELSFGTAKADPTHRQKLECLYRPRLQRLVHSSFLDADGFFGSYQLFRNLSYLQRDGDHVVFVVPRGNTPAANHASVVLEQALLPGVQGAHLVTVESIVEAIDGASDLDQYRGHYRLFAEKYLPAPAQGAA